VFDVVVDVEARDQQHDRDYCAIHAQELDNDDVRIDLYADSHAPLLCVPFCSSTSCLP
jgi:hypothetical protein